LFDFLKQTVAAALSFGGDAAAQAAPGVAKREPPPPKLETPSVEPTAQPDPAAVSEVFSGLADDEAYGAASTGIVDKSQAHTLQRNRPIDLMKPSYRQLDLENNIGQREGESDESFREKLRDAAENYGDQVLYSDMEGYKGERDLSRIQRGWWNGFTDPDRQEPYSEKKLAALKIGLNEGNMPLAHNTRIDDLESPAGRMETLNMLSQNMDPNDPNYKDGREVTNELSCAGASIVGGVLLAKGRDGLKTLYGAVGARKPEDEKPEEKALREKLESGQNLTIGDLQTLQHMVYVKLNENEGLDAAKMEEQVKIAAESKDPEARAEAKKQLMVGAKGMEVFMDDNPEIAKMFSDNKLDLVAIDTDDDRENGGDGSGNHIVLRVDGPDGQPLAYYDPWKKKGDQGQIINAQDENIERNSQQVPAAVLDDYKKAERVRGHYDQSKSAREYTERILDKHGRPDDQFWWTDDQEKKVREMEGG
jgi:hypothetical protein